MTLEPSFFKSATTSIHAVNPDDGKLKWDSSLQRNRAEQESASRKMGNLLLEPLVQDRLHSTAKRGKKLAGNIGHST